MALIELGDVDATSDPTAEWDAQGWLPCRLRLTDLRDLASAVARCRRLLDLDADAQAVRDVLAADPLLTPLVRAVPGRRVPGHVDGFELAVRAVLGQQVSVSGARTLAGRLANTLGAQSPLDDDQLTRVFPTAADVADADPAEMSLTRARATALTGLARAVDSGDVDLDAGADREESSARLLALPGVGPWTVAYIRMRALGDPDVFMSSDLGVRRGLEALGVRGDVRSAELLSRAWQPWRSYALQHVWAADTAGRLTVREEKTA